MRQKIIEIAAEGWGVPGGYIGPHTPYGLPLEELKQYPQFGEDMARRQAEAKRLLAEAGHAQGLDGRVLGAPRSHVRAWGAVPAR